MRIEAVGEGESGALVLYGASAIGEQRSVTIVDRDGQTAAQDSFGCVARPKRLCRFLGDAEPLDRLMLRLEVIQRSESLFRRGWGNCSGNCTVPWNWYGTVPGKKAGRIAGLDALDVGCKRNLVAAGFGCEAVEQSLLGGNDQGSIASSVADRAGTAKLGT